MMITNYFVLTFENIDGQHLVSLNIHGLINLTDNYKKIGPLDRGFFDSSSFPF